MQAAELPTASGTELDSTLPVEVESTGRKEVGRQAMGGTPAIFVLRKRWTASAMRVPSAVSNAWK
jgi:hypothetical protein